MMQTNSRSCKCPHHKMGPVLIILLGLLWLLSALDVISLNIVSITLPVIIIVIGLMVLFRGDCPRCNHDDEGKCCDTKPNEINK